jgi:hypothetical protein
VITKRFVLATSLMMFVAMSGQAYAGSAVQNAVQRSEDADSAETPRESSYCAILSWRTENLGIGRTTGGTGPMQYADLRIAAANIPPEADLVRPLRI